MFHLLKNIDFLRILRIFLMLVGAFFLLLIILAFTTAPFWGYHWLGTSKSKLKWKPQAIVLLGGGGMPSESNLIRSWFASRAAAHFEDAWLIIAMPGNENDSTSTPFLMKKELILRGVNPERILFESKGTNTRSQALSCREIISRHYSILLVSSPEHMRRAVLSFQKAGFEKVNALPAFEDGAEADFSFDDDLLGEDKPLVPDIGQNLQVRYQVWTHLKYEIQITREMAALFYYRLRGWI